MPMQLNDCLRLCMIGVVAKLLDVESRKKICCVVWTVLMPILHNKDPKIVSTD
jgi:hypothetical protein